MRVPYSPLFDGLESKCAGAGWGPRYKSPGPLDQGVFPWFSKAASFPKPVVLSSGKQLRLSGSLVKLCKVPELWKEGHVAICSRSGSTTLLGLGVHSCGTNYSVARVPIAISLT